MPFEDHEVTRAGFHVTEGTQRRAALGVLLRPQAEGSLRSPT
jgi:hypothetical protein